MEPMLHPWHSMAGPGAVQFLLHVDADVDSKHSETTAVYIAVQDRVTDSAMMCHDVTFTINIPQMLAYIPYMDPMGSEIRSPSQAPVALDI